MKPRDVLAKMRYCLTCTFAGTKIMEFVILTCRNHHNQGAWHRDALSRSESY